MRSRRSASPISRFARLGARRCPSRRRPACRGRWRADASGRRRKKKGPRLREAPLDPSDRFELLADVDRLLPEIGAGGGIDRTNLPAAVAAVAISVAAPVGIG